ncbi:MAG: ABC transporter permease [Oscillospiraceae bacterium]|nr:ABC transporter permease [Oscillospiraceae bacterium]
MSRLLKANFARLLKNKTFHICMFIMFGFAVAVLFASSSDESFVALDGLLFVGSFFVGIAIAVFVGIFIGTEYSDGTLRSKLTSGHSRITVYLANLISCTAAGILLFRRKDLK